MAMTVRLTSENEILAKQRAEQEGISVNALINKAIAEYTEKVETNEQVVSIVEKNMVKYAEILERLA